MQDAYDDLVWRETHHGEPENHIPLDHSDFPDDDAYEYECGWDVNAEVTVKNEDMHYFTDARQAFAETTIMHLSDWDNLDVLECITYDTFPQDNDRTLVFIYVDPEDYFTEERMFELRDALASFAIVGDMKAEDCGYSTGRTDHYCVYSTVYEYRFDKARASVEGLSHVQVACDTGDEAFLVNGLPELFIDNAKRMTVEDFIHALPHDLKQKIRDMSEDEVFADEDRFTPPAPVDTSKTSDGDSDANGDATGDVAPDSSAAEALSSSDLDDLEAIDLIAGNDDDDIVPFDE